MRLNALNTLDQACPKNGRPSVHHSRLFLLALNASCTLQTSATIQIDYLTLITVQKSVTGPLAWVLSTKRLRMYVLIV